MNHKRVTLEDIAREVGVSSQTVSRAINNKGRINSATRARVLAAAERLGYQPNAVARSLRAKRTHTIGFISDEIGTSPFAGQILQGAQDLAWEHDILLLSVNTSRQEGLKQAAVNTMLNRQVDGIIYAAMYHRAVNPPAIIRKTPTVLLDCFVPNRSLPSVVPDEQLGGYTATRYLLEKGYRQIAFINHSVEQPAAFGRLAGYRQALTEFGIRINPLLIAADRAVVGGGYRAAQEILKVNPRPEAIFCFNDRMALGAYQALNEHGVKIPDDIAIVGFDNEPDFATWFRPPLTTLQLPHYEMGQWAVDHLLWLIENPEQAKRPAVQKMLECPLVERESA